MAGALAKGRPASGPAPVARSAARFQAAMHDLGHPIEVVELPDSTRTAADAAAAIGCEVAQIVKSLVFRAPRSDTAVLVAAAGPNRVDEARIGAVLGERIEKADADFVRARTGYAIGGVPPVGHATPLVTFVDRELAEQAVIWAAAGTPHAVFRLSGAELVAMTNGTVRDVG